MKHAAHGRTMRRGEGYLTFMAHLQIAAGALSVLFSILALVQGLAGNAGLLSPGAVSAAISGSIPGAPATVIAGYLGFQMTYGWFLGLLLIVAGACCLEQRGRWLVATSAVANLINFPHGTTVAIMVLHGLGRRDIARAFRSRSRSPERWTPASGRRSGV